MEAKKQGRPAKEKTIETQPEAPQQNEPTRVYIIGKCPNPVWLRGMLEDQTRCSVKLPKSSLADRLIGKWVTVSKIDEEGENLYTYVA